MSQPAVVAPYWQSAEPAAAPPPADVDDPALSIPERLERVEQGLLMDAPEGLAEMLASSAAAVSDLATSYRNVSQLQQSGEVEVILHLRVRRDEDVAQRLDEAYEAEKARVLPLVAESGRRPRPAPGHRHPSGRCPP